MSRTLYGVSFFAIDIWGGDHNDQNTYVKCTDSVSKTEYLSSLMPFIFS
jgi:hypothetical protein